MMLKIASNCMALMGLNDVASSIQGQMTCRIIVKVPERSLLLLMASVLAIDDIGKTITVSSWI